METTAKKEKNKNSLHLADHEFNLYLFIKAHSNEKF